MSSGLALEMQRVHGGRWKRYPAYKDSGVGWLGDVPEHWGVNRLKFLFQFLDNCRIPVAAEDRAVMAKIYPYYGASGIIDHVEDYIFDESLILVAEDGANLLSRSTPLAFIANGKYWVNNHAHILRPISGQIIFWEGVLQTYEYEPLVTGAAQPKVTKENLGSILLPRPTVEEQRAIAAFLDHETGRIDVLIAKKERQIELLREKRAALISHAVTKGLDPNAPIKDSGVEWLGEVPERWGLKRLKYLASESLKYGANESAELDDPDLPRYIRITDIAEDGSLRVDTFKSLPEDVARPYLLKSGDILFARSGATVGKSFIYHESWGRACYAGYLIRLRLNSRVAAPAFLSYFASSSAYWDWASSIFIQATIQNISAEKYANLSVAIPPLPEQHVIAAFLNHATGHIDALTTKVHESITKLREYRTALISAAVTGKIDVRGEET